MKGCLCGTLLVPQCKVFEVAALLLAGWTVHQVRDQSLAKFLVLFFYFK